jgi:hypothetical protein
VEGHRTPRRSAKPEVPLELSGSAGIRLRRIHPCRHRFLSPETKRVVKLVSSTLLWQKFLADTQASAPFQKLRKNWLLYLQILLLLLAVLALARPYIKTTATPSQKRVVILDGSASMQRHG